MRLFIMYIDHLYQHIQVLMYGSVIEKFICKW
jgi:hypothetical protein